MSGGAVSMSQRQIHAWKLSFPNAKCTSAIRAELSDLYPLDQSKTLSAVRWLDRPRQAHNVWKRRNNSIC